MWELIQRNRTKSLLLFFLMGCCLVTLGYFIGAAYLPENGGPAGIGIALAIWLLLSLISFFAGDSLVLSSSRARQITRDIHPQLFNVVEEMKIAGSLPAVPKIYIIDEPAPNAFATGRKPENSSIAVTTGLLSRLNRDELQGVIAHETSHILNRDILFMTFAGVMLGGIVIISEIFLRGLWFSGGSSRRYRSGDSKGGGQAQAIIMIVAIAFAILAPIMARLLYFAISRRREYLADASAVRLTRYPEGLASALEKISRSTEDMPHVSKATAPLYIVNPLKAKGMKISDLTSTHPPITERIKILRAISHGAGFAAYQDAFDAVKGRKTTIIPSSGLKDTESVPLRTPSGETLIPLKPGKRTELGDLTRAVNGFLFLTCACGLKIKVPPDFKKPSLACPRCSREVHLPVAEMAVAGAVLDQVAKNLPQGQQAHYTRRGTGWESFSCTCGNTLQIAPSFDSDRITCDKCGRETAIEKVA